MHSGNTKACWKMLFLGAVIVYLTLTPVIRFPLTSLLKPLPILCLLVLCLNSRLACLPRNLLALALLFSVCGDIALTLPLAYQLELGLGFFLVTHVSYIRLFMCQVEVIVFRVLLSLVLICVSVCFFCWIMPHLGSLKLPVALYFSVITLMAICAFLGHGHNRRIVFGALCFMGSDAVIALDYFIYPESNFSFLVMLTYYTAQYCIVTGVLSGARSAQENDSLDPDYCNELSSSY